MIFIIDVAAKTSQTLHEISEKITNNLINYKHQFGIGVTDANLETDSVSFTLEAIVKNVKSKKEDYEDIGLLIDAVISFRSSPEINDNRVIEIDFDLFRSNGSIIKTKSFSIDPYEDEGNAMRILKESLDYLIALSETLYCTLLKEYLTLNDLNDVG